MIKMTDKFRFSGPEDHNSVVSSSTDSGFIEDLFIVDSNATIKSLCVSYADYGKKLKESVDLGVKWLHDNVLSNNHDGYYTRQKLDINKGTYDTKFHQYLIHSCTYWLAKLATTKRKMKDRIDGPPMPDYGLLSKIRQASNIITENADLLKDLQKTITQVNNSAEYAIDFEESDMDLDKIYYKADDIVKFTVKVNKNGKTHMVPLNVVLSKFGWNISKLTEKINLYKSHKSSKK